MTATQCKKKQEEMNIAGNAIFKLFHDSVMNAIRFDILAMKLKDTLKTKTLTN